MSSVERKKEKMEAFKKSIQHLSQKEQRRLIDDFIKTEMEREEMGMKKLTAVVLGYGMRGSAYAKYASEHPEELEIVAIAEPVDDKRNHARDLHNLSEDMCFVDWKQVAELPKLADFAIIATQDDMHYEPALAMIEKGYNLLLEKPMAPTAAECKKIAEAAEAKGVKVVVCHVLRFTNFFCTLKEIIYRDDIGEIMSIVHMENVGNVHQSHSFVRGNWRNSEESAPMILAKSCHDTDILQWLIGKKCKKVQSFGSLVHFTKENRPAGAPDYCIQGCPKADTCFYNAVKLYYDDKDNLWFRGVATDKVAPTDEEVKAAITRGPYGRCVYACDNDVVDHQVVNMEFEGGATVSFTMNAFNKGGRFIRIFGTKGEINAAIEDDKISVYSFATGETTDYNLAHVGEDITSGHAGGDTGIMMDILKYFGEVEKSKSICDVRTSYMNHLIAFAAEESRKTDKVIDLEKYSNEIK